MSESNQEAWLIEMRQEYGITQEQLAKALGITSRTVINWEGGHHEPKLTIRQVKILCRLFNKSIEEIPDNFPLHDSKNKNAETLTN